MCAHDGKARKTFVIFSGKDLNGHRGWITSPSRIICPWKLNKQSRDVGHALSIAMRYHFHDGCLHAVRNTALATAWSFFVPYAR